MYTNEDVGGQNTSAENQVWVYKHLRVVNNSDVVIAEE